jgi:hypothetical protein
MAQHCTALEGRRQCGSPASDDRGASRTARFRPVTLKSSFPEWYGHDEDTVKKIVTDGSICFDANALLDLYRVNKDQREEILAVLEGVSGRIFIPYQVAWEFHKNRLSAVRSNQAIYTTLLDSRFELQEKNLKQLHDEKLREEIKELHKEISKTFDKAVTKFQTAVAKLRDEHTISIQKMIDDDPVLETLESALTESNIGLRPTSDVLKNRREAALGRLQLGIPPGFKDSGKDDPTGDYLIWCELVDHAEESGRPLLFVTNDKKEDWYRSSVSGTSLGPRAELVVEMRERSPETLYHQADLGSFLYYAREYLGLSVEDDTIATVENIEPDPVSVTASTYTYPGIAGLDSETLARAYPNLLGPASPIMQSLGTFPGSPAQTLGTFQPPQSLVDMTNSIAAQAKKMMDDQHSGLVESIRRLTENVMPRPDFTSITAGLTALGQLNPNITAGLSTLGHLNPNIYPTSTPAAASAVQQLLNPRYGAGGASSSVTQSTAAAERVKKSPHKKAPAKKAGKKSLPTKSNVACQGDGTTGLP